MIILLSWLMLPKKGDKERLIIFFPLFFNYPDIVGNIIGNCICFLFFPQTIGNHEFDNNVEGVVPFLKMVKAPVVVTNIDATEEPTMQVRSYFNFLLSEKFCLFFLARQNFWHWFKYWKSNRLKISNKSYFKRLLEKFAYLLIRSFSYS